MSQLLHIFKKDVRHHWIEILASLALLAAYTWHVIHQWGADPPGGLQDLLWKAVMVLLPASWCLVVIRVIQDESLVGDRQFWITRPYEWASLAGAKLLSALVFIHVPLLIAQIIMLNRAGFPADHYVKGLLWLQMLIFFSIVLTSSVAAVVTSGIVQVLLSVVGLALYLFAMAELSDLFPGSNMPSSNQISDYWSIGSLAAVALFIIVMQYGWRKTWVSRLIILGLALFGIVATFTPNFSKLSDVYPLPGPGEQPAVHLAVLAKGSVPATKEEAPITGQKVTLVFDLIASQVEAATVGALDGMTVTLNVPNGPSWNSNWIGDYNRFYPGDEKTSVSVAVDRKFFDANKNTPLDVHFAFAITGYRETNIRKITAGPGMFPIDGIGICWVDERGFGEARIGCRAPLREPSLIARVDSSASTCLPQRGDDPALHESLYAWLSNGDPDPADFGISTVKFFDFDFSPQFSASEGSGRSKSPLSVCVGTPFTIARPEIFQHVHVDADLHGVKLSDYAMRPLRFSFR
jgi:hypothetical protein